MAFRIVGDGTPLGQGWYQVGATGQCISVAIRIKTLELALEKQTGFATAKQLDTVVKDVENVEARDAAQGEQLATAQTTIDTLVDQLETHNREFDKFKQKTDMIAASVTDRLTKAAVTVWGVKSLRDAVGTSSDSSAISAECEGGEKDCSSEVSAVGGTMVLQAKMGAVHVVSRSATA
jgi:hypothetical protein